MQTVRMNRHMPDAIVEWATLAHLNRILSTQPFCFECFSNKFSWAAHSTV